MNNIFRVECFATDNWTITEEIPNSAEEIGTGTSEIWTTNFQDNKSWRSAYKMEPPLTIIMVKRTINIPYSYVITVYNDIDSSCSCLQFT